jgi:hypothetical protein
MFEERANPIRLSGDIGQLRVPLIRQFLPGAWRTTRDTRAPGVTPNQLIGIQVWRIAGQKVQRQPALEATSLYAKKTLPLPIKAKRRVTMPHLFHFQKTCRKFNDPQNQELAKCLLMSLTKRPSLQNNP